jgi:hypothetical protein
MNLISPINWLVGFFWAVLCDCSESRKPQFELLWNDCAGIRLRLAGFVRLSMGAGQGTPGQQAFNVDEIMWVLVFCVLTAYCTVHRSQPLASLANSGFYLDVV